MFGGIKLSTKVFDKVEFGFGKFVGLPDFVAELSERNNFIDIQVDAPALNHVRQKTKSQCIRTTFRNTLTKLMF